MKTSSIQVEFRKQSDPTVAEHSTRFFKTGKGEYAENDKFLGIRVPKIRAFAKRGRDRNAGYPTPLAQITACASNAPGSCLEFWRQSELPDTDG